VEHGPNEGKAGEPPPDIDGSSVTLPPAPRSRRAQSAVVAALVAGLGIVAWYASGRYFGDKAKQEAADRWDALRLCVLGDRLLPGIKPSERVRLIRLANPEPPKAGDWPTRCVDHAERLDDALAVRAVNESVGPTPSAGYLTRRLDDAGARADLDLLHEILDAADLPLPRRSRSVPMAPAPAKVQLTTVGIDVLGKALRLNDIDVAFDPRTGRSARLLVPEKKPLVCHLDEGAPEVRWTHATCRTSLLSAPRGRLSLALTEQGAPDLLRVQDAGDLNGFHDAASGLRVWPSRYFDAQAHVSASGVTTIVAAQLEDEESRGKVDHFRLIRSAPGERPKPRRLPLPSDARMLLLPQALLWWAQAPGAKSAKLTAQPLEGTGDAPLAAARALGDLHAESRAVGFCGDGATTAVLFTAGIHDRRYALLFHGPDGFAPLSDVGVIEGRVTLSCHEGAAMLMRVADRRITRWRCTRSGCQVGSSSALPALEGKTWAAGPVGDKVAVVWTTPGGALRLRLGTPDALATMADSIVLDDPEHGGLEVTDLRLVTAGGTGLLLVHDQALRVFALRLDGRGTASAVRVTR
jgi:hypothetical protein